MRGRDSDSDSETSSIGEVERQMSAALRVLLGAGRVRALLLGRDEAVTQRQAR